MFIEFTVYNPYVNLFVISTLYLEYPGSGGGWASYRFEPANLLGMFGSGISSFQIGIQVLFCILLAAIIVKEGRKLYRQRKAYFRCIWNWVEVSIVILSIVSMLATIFVIFNTLSLTEKFARYHGNVYMKFQFVAYWHEHLVYVTSFIVFLATVKFVRLLRFNKRMGMLGAVISYASDNLWQFCFMFFVVFIAFVCSFHLMFVERLMGYSTFILTTESLMEIALGKVQVQVNNTNFH